MGRKRRARGRAAPPGLAGARRRVPGYSGYEVTRDGSCVYSRASRSPLPRNAQWPDPPEVWAYEDATGRMRRVTVAELVRLAWGGG